MTKLEMEQLAEVISGAVSEAISKQEHIDFPTGSIPVCVVARVYGKDADWVKAGIISGWLPIGRATRHGKLITSIKEMDSRLGKINYQISPKKLYEDTGFIWNGERTADELEKKT